MEIPGLGKSNLLRIKHLPGLRNASMFFPRAGKSTLWVFAYNLVLGISRQQIHCFCRLRYLNDPTDTLYRLSHSGASDSVKLLGLYRFQCFGGPQKLCFFPALGKKTFIISPGISQGWESRPLVFPGLGYCLRL